MGSLLTTKPRMESGPQLAPRSIERWCELAKLNWKGNMVWEVLTVTGI